MSWLEWTGIWAASAVAVAAVCGLAYLGEQVGGTVGLSIQFIWFPVLFFGIGWMVTR